VAVDAAQVNASQESDSWWFIGVRVRAMDVNSIDPTVVIGVARPNDGAVPAMHLHVVRIAQTIADCSVRRSFFTLLKLFKQTKTSGNNCEEPVLKKDTSTRQLRAGLGMVNRRAKGLTCSSC
jgi:hypothetical protein